MKTEVQEKGPTERLVVVELPERVVARKLEQVYRNVVRDIQLPGFRRGHVPRRLLEAQFGQDFLYEDSQKELIREFLPQALQELELQPVAEPQTRVVQFEEGKPFIFQIELEILPQIEIEDYLGIEVEREPKPRVTKQDVQGELDRLRREHATLLPKEEDRVEVGDVAIINERIIEPRGTVVNERQDMELLVESDEGFSAELLGKRVGEEVEFPLDEGHRSLIRVEELKQVELPPLDDEFARDRGCEDLERLEEKIREELGERFAHEYERQMKLKVLDELIDRTPITIPPQLIEGLLQQDLEALQQRGVTPPQEEELAEERRQKTHRIKRELVLSAVKRSEGLELTDEEFEEELEREAERRGVNPRKFKGLLEREGQLKGLRRHLEDERVLDFLYQNATVKDKKEKER